LTKPDITISLIVAAAENNVIGRSGGLPWRLSSDLKLFRTVTMGKPVVMGRRTFESIGKPLDGRTNIVITRRDDFTHDEVVVVASVEAALAAARSAAMATGADEIMIIGGSEIYRLLIVHAGRIYLTRVHATPEGDADFPELDPEEWHEVAREPLPKGQRDQHSATLVTLERVQNAA
jgi:dihydrofolate reductase